MNINIVYNRSNVYGLAADATVLTAAIRATAPPGAIGQIHIVDPREPPRAADIQFHLEHPIYAACPWATVNILLVNLEHYVPAAYNSYLASFDQIWVRDTESSKKFTDIAHRIPRVIPWAVPAAVRDALMPKAKGAAAAAVQTFDKSRGFVAFLGGSESKAAATAKVVSAWLSTDPPLHIYVTRQDLATTLREAAGDNERITIEARELAESEVRRLQLHYPGHLIVSEGEGFGYAAAEAEAAGAFAIMTDLPVFRHYYGGNNENVSYISVTPTENHGRFTIRDRAGSDEGVASLRSDLERAFLRFIDYDQGNVAVRRVAAALRLHQSEAAIGEAMLVAIQHVKDCKAVNGGIRNLPPVLTGADCPPITVVTLTYNRRKFIDLAFLNLMITDYPKSKIEWIVVEDSDDQDKAASDKIFGFAGAHPEIQVAYVPLAKKTPIGAKRNAGIERARNDIILMMDDDDYYPETSLRRRVAWLTKTRLGTGEEPQVAACTMLAMYDLLAGKSAVNVPPWNLELGGRISEATLTFRKSFWLARPFPEVGMAEAEGWIAGRETEVLEIPPQQIIVAMSHGQNVSSRKVPADAPVSCFWGFEKELLVFLHGLAGVKVEEDKTVPVAAKKRH